MTQEQTETLTLIHSLLAQIAATKAETAQLKKANDEYAFRIMKTSQTVN